MADENAKFEKNALISMKLSILRFLRSLKPNLDSDFQNYCKNGGFNMADQKFKNSLIFIKMGIIRFFGTLNIDLLMKFQN